LVGYSNIWCHSIYIYCRLSRTLGSVYGAEQFKHREAIAFGTDHQCVYWQGMVPFPLKFLSAW